MVNKTINRLGVRRIVLQRALGWIGYLISNFSPKYINNIKYIKCCNQYIYFYTQNKHA